MRTTLKSWTWVLLLVGGVIMVARGVTGSADKKPETAAVSPRLTKEVSGPWQDFRKPAAGELREELDPLQYRVTQEAGTEPAFQNAYWNNHEAGLYVDVVSGEPLFTSMDKYDSGTGWPSFTRPVVEGAVTEHKDGAFGMNVVEIRSRLADSHLGHVFGDGPAPTGLRYCMNSAALRFIPVDRLQSEGYGDFLVLFQPKENTKMTAAAKREIATLAGGCFWGMEDILRDIPGVLETEVGYTGGRLENPTYEDLKGGNSGHAESIQVTFDPTVISYEQILGYFFRMHDPTTKNRQGNDVGSQYRSAIFFHDETQRVTADKVKREVGASGKWTNLIQTEITAAGIFYPAEEYHQDYLEKHPNGYTCHYLRD